jgi:hypothetical protein
MIVPSVRSQISRFVCLSMFSRLVDPGARKNPPGSASSASEAALGALAPRFSVHPSQAGRYGRPQLAMSNFRSNHGGRQSGRLGHMPGLSLAPLPVDTRPMAAQLASMTGDPDIPPSIFRFLMIKNLPPLWTRQRCHFLSSDRTHAAVPLVIPHSRGATAIGGFPIIITAFAVVNVS